MADHETGNRGDMEIGAHVSTYGSVINMFFWGAIGCAIVAALVIWLIS